MPAEPPPLRPGARGCDHPDCLFEGTYRAPKSREANDGHYWFCLDHVRDYNARWNFFAGMSPDQIEHYTRNNSTWQRPTWKLGSKPDRGFGSFVRDDLGLLSEVGLDPGESFQAKRPPESAPSSKERQALATLDLAEGATEAEIKARYKELAKRYHPDITQGDKAAEERFKAIAQAYATLTQRPA